MDKRVRFDIEGADFELEAGPDDLRDLVKRTGLSLRDLSIPLGASPSTISRWLRGVNDPPDYFWRALPLLIKAIEGRRTSGATGSPEKPGPAEVVMARQKELEDRFPAAAGLQDSVQERVLHVLSIMPAAIFSALMQGGADWTAVSAFLTAFGDLIEAFPEVGDIIEAGNK